MLVNSRSAHRYAFKCRCCQTDRRHRKRERRMIKRRERQAWKRERNREND